MAESEERIVPESVKTSEFGCPNCLWNGCECKLGCEYVPDGKGGCESYVYCN